LEEQEGRRTLGRPRRGWEDNMRMFLGKIGWKGMKWMHVARVRYQWRTHLNTIVKGVEFLDKLSYY
jgi:hypothetical protein